MPTLRSTDARSKGFAYVEPMSKDIDGTPVVILTPVDGKLSP